MKLPPKYPKDLHPLSTAELIAMGERWAKAPASDTRVDLRAALWEIRRLKVFISQVQACCKEIDYLYFPGRPEPMSGIRRELAVEVSERRPEPTAAKSLEQRSAQARERMQKNQEAAAPGGHVLKVQKIEIPEEERNRPLI